MKKHAQQNQLLRVCFTYSFVGLSSDKAFLSAAVCEQNVT